MGTVRETTRSRYKETVGKIIRLLMNSRENNPLTYEQSGKQSACLGTVGEIIRLLGTVGETIRLNRNSQGNDLLM